MQEPTQEQDILAKRFLDCAFFVHKELGPGLLEKTYEECLACVLEKENIPFKQQHPVPLIFMNKKIEVGYKADFIIDNSIIIELKAAEKLLPIHKAQLMTYMKIAKLSLGLLINFNSTLLKNGIQRVILSP